MLFKIEASCSKISPSMMSDNPNLGSSNCKTPLMIVDIFSNAMTTGWGLKFSYKKMLENVVQVLYSLSKNDKQERRR